MQLVRAVFGYASYFLIFSNCRVQATQLQGIYFQCLNGKLLLLKDAFLRSTFMSYYSDKKGCVSYCLTNPTCKSADFRISTGECSLFELNSWENEFKIISDSDGIIIQKMKEPVVTHGEWTMVFRAVANINRALYEDYFNTSLYHDQPLNPMYPIGCLRLDTNLTCDHHFRSKLLNNWTELQISEVKFTIYKDGVLQNYILFIGTSSNWTSWYSPANVINSSWVDLKNSHVKYFSIFRHDPGFRRVFYIEHSHSDCNNVYLWFLCYDGGSDSCPWANPVHTFPRFLYSPTNKKVYHTELKLADVIAIFIKF